MYLQDDARLLSVRLVDLGFAASASTLPQEEVENAMRRGASSPLSVLPMLALNGEAVCHTGLAPQTPRHQAACHTGLQPPAYRTGLQPPDHQTPAPLHATQSSHPRLPDRVPGRSGPPLTRLRLALDRPARPGLHPLRALPLERRGAGRARCRHRTHHRAPVAQTARRRHLCAASLGRPPTSTSPPHRPQASRLRPRASRLRPQASGLKPQASGLSQP